MPPARLPVALRGPTTATFYRWAAAGLAIGAAVVLHVMAARDATGPAWPEDEIGPLANARVIAGVGPWALSYLPYYPGWSVVIAPLWWMTDDPGTVYRAAAVLSVIVALAAIAPLAALVRRVGLDRPTAVAVAAVVTLAPGRTVMSNYVLTENFLVLMVALTALAALRYYERPTVARALLLAAAAAYTFFTHGRAIAVVIATGIAFLLELRARRRQALVGGGALVVLTAAAYLAYTGIVGQIYDSGTGREATSIEALLSGDVVAILRAAIGQLWYQQAAWFALSFVGLSALGALAWREVRRRAPAFGTWAALAVLGVSGLMTLLLASLLVDPVETSRVDYWFYGRYLEPFFMPLVAVGLGVLVVGIGRRRAVGVGVAAVAATAAFALVNLPVIDPAKPLAVINVGGLLAWGAELGSITRRLVVVLTLVATLGLLGLAALLRRWSPLVLLPLAIAFAAGSVVTDARVVDVVNGAWRVDELGPLVARVVPADAAIAYDVHEGMRAEENRAAFWLSPHRVDPFDSSQEPPPQPWVVARNDWPLGEALGARRVASGAFPDNALWVMPGDEQDALAAEGLLERPADAPELRDARYEVAVRDVENGPCSDADGCDLTLAVTNDGIDVWSPLGTRPEDRGAVRVLFRWVDGGEVVATGYWDFTTSVFPGETVELSGTLASPPSAPRAVVEVALEQVGLGVLEADGIVVDGA